MENNLVDIKVSLSQQSVLAAARKPSSMERRWSFPSSQHCWDTPEVLYPLLGSLVEERHGDSGVGPIATKIINGQGTWGTKGCWGSLNSPVWRKDGEYISKWIIKDSYRSRLMSVMISERIGCIEQKSNMRILFKYKKIFFLPRRCSSMVTGCPKGPWSLHAWRCMMSDWAWSWVVCCKGCCPDQGCLA